MNWCVLDLVCLQVDLVVGSNAVQRRHLHLRRDSPVHLASRPRWLDGAGDLLLAPSAWAVPTSHISFPQDASMAKPSQRTGSSSPQHSAYLTAFEVPPLDCATCPSPLPRKGATCLVSLSRKLYRPRSMPTRAEGCSTRNPLF